MKSRVLIFHPGTQHSHQTALAFQNAGLLAWYATEIFYRPDRWPYKALVFVPGRARRRIEKELRRRQHPLINPAFLRTFGGWEWIERISMRLGLRGVEHYANEWGNIQFGHKVARLAVRDHVDCVWGFDTASLVTFTEAKTHGIRCVLEQTIAHPRKWNRILTEERRNVGYAFDPYPRPYPERDLLRVDAEIRLSDQVVCGSEFAKQTMIEEGVNPDKITVIPYGVDADLFVPRYRPQKDGELRLLFVGHFGLRKGAWYLLQALERLQDLLRLTLTVVGKNTVPPSFLAPVAHKLNFISHVPHDQIHKVYQEGDVLVLPSLYEGSALVVNEAMASGLPVITTPNSGSCVRDGIEGFIVPIRDVDALASKIELLYRHGSLRAEMSQRARDRAVKLSWEKYRKGAVALLGHTLRLPLVEDRIDDS
jgi:glycosyltransferase involved in cell wall biosynthesis